MEFELPISRPGEVMKIFKNVKSHGNWKLKKVVTLTKLSEERLNSVIFMNIGLRKVKNCGLNISCKIEPLKRRFLNVYFP